MRRRKVDKEDALRKQAEERLAGRPEHSEIPEGDFASLVHEFQVHQSELEIQNEELRLAQEIIETVKKRFSDLYDFAPVGYFTIGKEGRIIEANLTAARLLGFDKSDLIGKPFNAFVHPEDKDIIYLHLRSIRKSEPATCDSRLVKSNAVSFPAQLISTPLAEASQASETSGEFLIAVFDISARKSVEDALVRQTALIEERRKEWESSIEELNERLLVSNRELEGLGHTLSHDLRGPLRSIEGFTAILLERYSEKLDAEGKEFLNIVNQSAQRMRDMISGLLDLSSIAHTKIQRQKINISEIVGAIVQENRNAQPDREVEVSIQADLFAEGDGKLLRIAIDNLVRNAWKFTGKRSKAVIEFGKTENGGKAAFFLRDNGAGFDLKYAGQMFTVFKRLHSDSEFKGTGIGLATAQRIINRHGGEIWATGEVDKGATFFFTLP